MGIFNIWKPRLYSRILVPILLIGLILPLSSCIYFNTFFNIRKNFNSAEETRRKDGRDEARGSEIAQYKVAIEKSSQVLERHPTSSWVDDALFIIGASYYHLGEYDNAARKFKELFVNYPESEYIRPSRLLMAKAKLELGEEAEAVVIFEEVLEEEPDRGLRAQAARALGRYYFNNKDYEKSSGYFQSLIDSLGRNEDKLQAYEFLADGYFDLFQFEQAQKNYEAALDQNPDTLKYYRLSYRLAETCYFLNDLRKGMNILNSLIEDETYFDSLAVLRLKLAQGQEWDGDLQAAIGTYEKVIEESPRTPLAATAYYEMGLIYQYEYEDLEQAGELYEKARAESRRSPIYQDATQRASDIALLEQYTTREFDLSADSTGEVDLKKLDQAGRNQFLLGELFYHELEKPDSARVAFQALVDKFSASTWAPAGYLALAHIYRHDENDPAIADSLLWVIIRQYPHSDQVQVAVQELGLGGTAIDSGYAESYMYKAESYYTKFAKLDSVRHYVRLAADSGQQAVRSLKGDEYVKSLTYLDSARSFYQFVADSFPQSTYRPQAEYALVWLYDEYETPGDSSLIDMYANFVDSFPNSDYTTTIAKEYNIRPSGAIIEQQKKENQQGPDSLLANADSTAAVGDSTAADTAQGLSPIEVYTVGPDGEPLPPAQNLRMAEKVAFKYPIEAVHLEFEGKLYFHIRIDFSGEVSEARLQNPTESEELNKAVQDVVENTTFDVARIPPDLYDSWFYYVYTVRFPEEYRR